MNVNSVYKILVIFNLFLLAWRYYSRWSPQAHSASQHVAEYSYHGTDYPFNLPLYSDITNDPVAMTLHETLQVQFNTTEGDLLATAPKEAGRTRLGPDHRVFNLVFYHHVHCLWSIQKVLDDPNGTYAGYEHLHHCFNYLRQTLLCHAADTLELGDFMERDFENDRVGDTLVCRDWQKVYTTMDVNYRSWTEWEKHWN